MIPPSGNPTPRGSITAETKAWVEKITIAYTVDLQQKLVAFLLKAYGWLLGTHNVDVLASRLESALIKWLGTATIGEIAGLLTLTFGAVFKVGKKVYDSSGEGSPDKNFVSSILTSSLRNPFKLFCGPVTAGGFSSGAPEVSTGS